LSAQLLELRRILKQRVPDALPLPGRVVEPVSTGIAELDRILPGGGLPRGRLTVWMPQGGAASVLRAACQATVGAGERSVWIDGMGTVAGASWEEGPILVRPKSRKHALRSVDELLRSGAFALVVLAGAEPEGTETVRLSRAAREGGGAFVALTANASLASLRLTSRILPHSYRWQRDPFGDPAEVEDATVQVRARSLGWNAHTQLRIPVMRYDLRLSLDPGVVDRRGLPR
jgi:hypothetical protein